MERDLANSFEHAGLLVEIYYDRDAESPNEWGDDGIFLIAGHRDFYVRPPKVKQQENWSIDETKERYEKTHWVFGLEAYIHSGVVLALSRQGNFPDRQWDVSQLGLVFVSKKEFRLRKSAEKAARGLIETWNTYLGGEVFGYMIKNADGEDLDRAEIGDSCWGFYGEEHAISEAKSAAEYIAKKIRNEKEKKTKAYIKNRVPLQARVSA